MTRVQIIQKSLNKLSPMPLKVISKNSAMEKTCTVAPDSIQMVEEAMKPFDAIKNYADRIQHAIRRCANLGRPVNASAKIACTLPHCKGIHVDTYNNGKHTELWGRINSDGTRVVLKRNPNDSEMWKIYQNPACSREKAIETAKGMVLNTTLEL